MNFATVNKQLVCKGARSLELEGGIVPETPEDGVVIKIIYCGICHSDANVYENGAWDQRLLPKVLGHEISGTIYSKGNGVSNVNIGDSVLVYPYGGCRRCDYCKAGSVDCINKYQPYAHSYGIWKDGGYQQYIAIEDMWCVVPVPDTIPLDLACIVPCGGITAYNAVQHCQQSIKEAIRIKGKANIAIVGIGGLGIWAIQILKALHGNKVCICAIDIMNEKLSEAISSGADKTLCWSKQGNAKELSSKIAEKLDDELVDAAMDFVATLNTIERMFYALNFGSTLLIAGLFKSVLPTLNTVDFIIKHIKLQGIYSGSRKQVIQVLDLIQSKQVTGPLINHVSLDCVESVLTSMIEGKFCNGRAVVKM